MKRMGKFWVDDEGNRTLYRPTEESHIESVSDAIKRVVDGMDRSDDKLWTQQGKPQMSVIEKALGDTSITRAMVDEATGGVTREG